MKFLIVEDDAVSRKFMFDFLREYGECDAVIDGLEALDSFLLALKSGKPYDMVFLDVMLPKVDGIKVLKMIRELESRKGILPQKRSKIILTTALAETELVKNVLDCEAILPKPIDTNRLSELVSQN
jgi:two-component system chemotaxis response regulator CheY